MRKTKFEVMLKFSCGEMRDISEECVIDAETGKAYLLTGAGLADVGNAIVRQCTGLKDINGAEVYEGDIATHEDGEHGFIAVVEWMEYEFRFRIIKPFEDIYDFDDWCENGTLDVQVVGNIHETPELLEVLK